MATETQEPTLTIGDRVNYPYILSQAILNWIQSIVKAEGNYSMQEVDEASKALDGLILESWKDDKYFDDLNKAKTTSGYSLSSKQSRHTAFPSSTADRTHTHLPLFFLNCACTDAQDHRMKR